MNILDLFFIGLFMFIILVEKLFCTWYYVKHSIRPVLQELTVPYLNPYSPIIEI
jgi:hypothetical protein